MHAMTEAVPPLAASDLWLVRPLHGKLGEAGGFGTRGYGMGRVIVKGGTASSGSRENRLGREMSFGADIEIGLLDDTPASSTDQAFHPRSISVHRP
jgi:hypothetical protein